MLFYKAKKMSIKKRIKSFFIVDKRLSLSYYINIIEKIDSRELGVVMIDEV